MEASRLPRTYTVIKTATDKLSEPLLEKECYCHDNGNGVTLPHKAFTQEVKVIDGETRVYRNNPCRDCERGKSKGPSIDTLRNTLDKLLAENKRLRKKVEGLDKNIRKIDKIMEVISDKLDIEFDSNGDEVI